MSNAFRRFEMLLPLRFNDGQSVPHELIADSLLEIRERFGAVSCESRWIRRPPSSTMTDVRTGEESWCESHTGR